MIFEKARPALDAEWAAVCLATNAKRVCAEVMRKQDRESSRFAGSTNGNLKETAPAHDNVIACGVLAAVFRQVLFSSHLL
jgi:hypothetical protein